jgi:nucleoside-diphosphate-sugar epimerase
MHGVDCVVHLAAEAHDVPFDQLIGPNVRGLFRVLDAARRAGVRRVVLASSIQVVGRRQGEGILSTEASSPANHYALTKAWAEQMGSMYARCYGLGVISVRIAWMVRDVTEARRLHEAHLEDLYLSRRDVARFMALAVEAGELPFTVLYAASRGGERHWDMEPARRLIGYEARDRFPDGLGFDFDPGDHG